MNIPLGQTSKVIAGAELKQAPRDPATTRARCILSGTSADGQPATLALSDDTLSKHLLFLGEIGSGKTNAIYHLIAQLRKDMPLNDVMIIFDTKGDFYSAFHRSGDVVISNDNKATGPAGADYWNIFREFGTLETLEEDAQEITRSLFYERSLRSSQPFFPNAAKDLFAAIMMHFARRQAANATNAAMRAMLDSATPSDLRALLQEHDDLRAITSYIADDRSPQTQGVFSELQQTVREVFVGNFKRAGNLSIREAVRGKGARAIFVEYDLGMGNVLTPIYRLLIDLAIKEALCRSKSEGNVWFIVDEFRLLPNLQHVDDGVNFGRSLGAKFVIGVQNIEQVFAAYGEPMARNILSGFLTTVAFRVNDPSTRSFVEQLYGKNRVFEVTPSTMPGKQGMEQTRDGNVIEDWDISRLTVGKAIIGLPGQSPFIFKFDKFVS
jgi:type IV secretory pathway TraG/TraD family ATPase VirD4